MVTAIEDGHAGAMVDVFKALSFSDNHVIMREGDPGESAYLIEHGEVEVYRIVDGVKVLLGTVGEGGIVGEMALIDASPRMATVQATRKTTCIEITDKVFQKIMADANPILRSLVHAYLRNLRTLARRATETGAGHLLQSSRRPKQGG
jgi:CRP-like cAMP-binding protein